MLGARCRVLGAVGLARRSPQSGRRRAKAGVVKLGAGETMHKSLATAVTLLLAVAAVAAQPAARRPIRWSKRAGRSRSRRTPMSSLMTTSRSSPTSASSSARARRWSSIPGWGAATARPCCAKSAKVSKNTELYIASTHFHAEHTTGYVAFPGSAKYVNSKMQEAEFEQSGMQMVETFSERSPATAEILKDAARRPAAITFERDYTIDLGGVRVRCLVVGPTHTRGDTGFFVEGDNVLFAGDVVMNNSFLAATAVSSMKAWSRRSTRSKRSSRRRSCPLMARWAPARSSARNRDLLKAISARVRALKSRGPSRRRGRDDRPARDPGDATDLAARQRHRRAGAGGLQRAVIIDVQSITNRQ